MHASDRLRFSINKSGALALLLGSVLASGAVRADSGDSVADATATAPIWTFGGYGSVGLVHSSNDQADYTANVLNPGGAGYSRVWSPNVDSRLGAQIGVALDKRWSAVLQVISERNLDHSYRPAVEWANIKYQATPDLSLRLGRIALPVFIAGDYRKAGYALPWVRPPVELYGALPVSNSDGIDASYRWNIGGVKNVTQVFFGHTDVRISDTARAKAQRLTGLSNTSTSGALSVRASAMTTTLDVNVIRPLFAAFQQFGPQGMAIASEYDLKEKRTSIGGIGVSYDPGSWFVMSELYRINTRSYLGDKTAGYASAGYRFGDFTPYLTYAAVRSNAATMAAGLSLAGLPPQAIPTAAVLNATLNGVLRTVAEQHTISAGLRWDFQPGRALTLQYDRVRPHGDSNGTLVNTQAGFEPARPIDVTSILLDFVF